MLITEMIANTCCALRKSVFCRESQLYRIQDAPAFAMRADEPQMPDLSTGDQPGEKTSRSGFFLIVGYFPLIIA